MASNLAPGTTDRNLPGVTPDLVWVDPCETDHLVDEWFCASCGTPIGWTLHDNSYGDTLDFTPCAFVDGSDEMLYCEVCATDDPRP